MSASLEREATFVRPEWVKKPPVEGGEMEEALREVEEIAPASK